MAFYDYREPIEHVVDRYFERKRFHAANDESSGGVQLGGGAYPDDQLPDIPCLIIRDDEGIAYKFIYGDVSALEGEEEGSPVIWQEELIRDADGTVTQIITTYPDGESVTAAFTRDADDRVTEYTLG